MAVLSVKAAESKKKKIRLFASSGLKMRNFARKPEISFLLLNLEGSVGQIWVNETGKAKTYSVAECSEAGDFKNCPDASKLRIQISQTRHYARLRNRDSDRNRDKLSKYLYPHSHLITMQPCQTHLKLRFHPAKETSRCHCTRLVVAIGLNPPG